MSVAYPDAWPQPGQVREPSVEVTVGGLTFTGAQVVSVSTASEAASPLTDAMRRVSSASGAEATVVLADVSNEFSPWRRPDTLVGELVTIHAGPNTSSMLPAFTGVVMTAAGSATSGEMTLTCLDRTARFMRPFNNLRAAPVDGSALWVIDQIARQVGHFTTPRSIGAWSNVSAGVDASMMGAPAANVGTLRPLDNLEPEQPEFDTAPWGEALVSGKARFEFTRTGWNGDHAFYLQVGGDFALLRNRRPSVSTVRDVNYWGPYLQIDMLNTGGAGAASFLRVFPYMTTGSGSPEWGVVGRFSGELWGIPHVPGMAIRVRLMNAEPYSTGGTCEVTTSAGYHGTFNLGSTTLPDVGHSQTSDPLLTLRTSADLPRERGDGRTYERSNWLQGAFAHAATQIRGTDVFPTPAEWINSTTGDTDFSPSLNHLVYHPDVDNGWEAIQQIADAEGGACWISRDGVLTFRNREDLLYGRKGDVAREVTSQRDIAELSWEQSITDITTAVHLAHRHVTPPRSGFAWQADDVKQVEIPGGANTPVTEIVSIENAVAFTGNDAKFIRSQNGHRGDQSYYDAYWTNQANTPVRASIDVYAERLDPQTLQFTYNNTNTNPITYHFANPTFTEIPKLGWWCPSMVALGDEYAIEAPGWPEQNPDAPALKVHEVQHNAYRQDTSYAHLHARFLAGQYSSRAAIIESLDIVPDDTLHLTQQLVVHEPSRTGVEQRMVLLADERSVGGSGGVSQTISAAPMLWSWERGDFEDTDYWTSVLNGDVDGIPAATGGWHLKLNEGHSGWRALRCDGNGTVYLLDPRPAPRSRRVMVQGWAKGWGAPLRDIGGGVQVGQGAAVRVRIMTQTRTSPTGGWRNGDYWQVHDNRGTGSQSYGLWNAFGTPGFNKVHVDADMAILLPNDTYEWRVLAQAVTNAASPDAYWIIDDLDIREI